MKRHEFMRGALQRFEQVGIGKGWKVEAQVIDGEEKVDVTWESAEGLSDETMSMLLRALYLVAHDVEDER